MRLSAFDSVPFRKDESGRGVPEQDPAGYRDAFGALGTGDLDAALADARELLAVLRGLGIVWVCVTAGSPYYCPHVQRPALFPPSDGYLPPEDPLVGVARQIEATARLKAAFRDMVFVGSAYTYLQEWLPNVAERVVADGKADFVGLGRMVLSYPELPRDVLAGRPLDRRRLCRTFSDCTTAPRKALPSGCYPLDRFYAGRPEAARLKAAEGGSPRMTTDTTARPARRAAPTSCSRSARRSWRSSRSWVSRSTGCPSSTTSSSATWAGRASR